MHPLVTMPMRMMPNPGLGFRSVCMYIVCSINTLAVPLPRRVLRGQWQGFNVLER